MMANTFRITRYTGIYLGFIENPCVDTPGFLLAMNIVEQGKHITLLFP